MVDLNGNGKQWTDRVQWYRQVYLRSDWWRRRRRQALRDADWRCEDCGRDDVALEVHHRKYGHLFAERREDLRVLCAPCHDYWHHPRPGSSRPRAHQVLLPLTDTIPMGIELQMKRPRWDHPLPLTPSGYAIGRVYGDSEAATRQPWSLFLEMICNNPQLSDRQVEELMELFREQIRDREHGLIIVYLLGRGPSRWVPSIEEVKAIGSVAPYAFGGPLFSLTT